MSTHHNPNDTLTNADAYANVPAGVRRARLDRMRNSSNRQREAAEADAKAAAHSPDSTFIKVLKFLLWTNIAGIVFYTSIANFPMAITLIPSTIFIWLLIVFCK